MTGKPDYYEILGTKKSANQDEIRRAFRKKAVTLHPDRNPGDKVAEAKFKLVSEAYDVLSSVEKRKKYDGEVSAPPPPPPNYPFADVCVEIEVQGRETLDGVDKTVTVSRPRSCPDCRGSGRLQRNYERCQMCQGAGCAPCEWTGRLVHCGRCWGTGSDKEMTTLVVRVPPGSSPNGRQKFVAYGTLWGVRGPFYVYANVAPKVIKPGMILRG